MVKKIGVILGLAGLLVCGILFFGRSATTTAETSMRAQTPYSEFLEQERIRRDPNAIRIWGR